MVAALNHFPFKGQIDKVTITLTAPDTDRAKEFKMNESELVD